MASQNKNQFTYLSSVEHGFVYMRGPYEPWGEYHEYFVWRVNDGAKIKVLAKDLKPISGYMADQIISELEKTRQKLVKAKALERAREYISESISDASVGLLGNELVVFDKQIKFSTLDFYLLWGSARKSFIKIPKIDIRKSVIREEDKTKIQEAIESYVVWIASIDKHETPRDFVVEKFLSEEERKEVLLVDNHQSFLSGKGVMISQGYIRKVGFRVTHCWRCKQTLSSESHLACLGCQGLICVCGACLC